MSVSYKGYGTGFPFPLRYKSANGLPFEEWDGSSTDMGGSPIAASGAEVYGQGTRRVGMSISQLAELYWRVKELRVSYDYVFMYDGGSYAAGPASGLVSPIQVPYGTDVETAAMLCKKAASYSHYKSEILAVVGSSLLEINYEDIWVVGSVYYPSLRIGMGGLFNNVGTGSEGGGIDNPVSGLIVDFLGLVNLNLWGSNGLGTIGQHPPYSGYGTITIKPVSYFPYSGRWNTTTGEPT